MIGGDMGSDARKKLIDSFKDRFKLRRKARKLKKPIGHGTVVVIGGQVIKPKPKPLAKIGPLTGKSVTAPKGKKKPTAKGTAAAKKAWETRRANAEDPVQAEAERLEAIRILDEMAKNRPPVTEE